MVRHLQQPAGKRAAKGRAHDRLMSSSSHGCIPPQPGTHMTPTIRRSLLALTVVLATAGGLAACGHGPRGADDMGMDGSAGMMGHHGRHGGGPMSEADAVKMRDRMVERATTELKLDATQKQRLVVMLDKMHAQRQAMMGGAVAGKPPREELQALMSGARFDRSGAQALVDGKTAAVKAGSPELIAAVGDFYDGLTADQQTKVREFMAKGGRRGGMMGGHR
jgi:Spy/CpxP family protein refolding chaperone